MLLRNGKGAGRGGRRPSRRRGSRRRSTRRRALYGRSKRALLRAPKAGHHAPHDADDQEEHPNENADVAHGEDYLVVGPGIGGCCESVELSAETPIAPRISVSAWMFFRR